MTDRRPVVLYTGKSEEAALWEAHLRAAAADADFAVDLYVDPAQIAPEAVDYALYAPTGTVSDLRRYPNLKGIIGLWAGVEEILARDDVPEDVPLARMVEPGLTYGMTDYVVGHVMRHHMDLDGTLERHRARRWDDVHPPLSQDRVVGILGLGALGRDAAERLRALRFDVRGWSRTAKTIEGVRCAAGLETLDAFLAEIEILVVLLPQTSDTVGLLNAARLAQLPPGAYVINVARGPIVEETALLAALDGPLGGATLDVFDVEPLPEDHPYWRHPKVTITPHIASVTRPETASNEVIRQIKQAEAGMPLDHLVDRRRGY